MPSSSDPFALNIEGVQDLIGSTTNKVLPVSGKGQSEGAASQYEDALDLPMTDKELLELKDEWEEAALSYSVRMKETAKRNLRSYLGRSMQEEGVIENGYPQAANLQFEAEETFLPAATAQNPDPYVFADDTPEGNKIASDVQTMLQYHAAQLLLRRKLAMMTRQWSIYHLGVLKAGWNEEINEIDIDNRKIQDFVFDPAGYVNCYGEFTSWLGERIAVRASKLAEMFPDHKGYIEEEAHHKMGTKLIYTEWWNDDYCFLTFKERVLEKHRNQFFNWPSPKKDDTDLEDVHGKGISRKRNHFALPKKPYIFLSVFSLGEQPHDITGLLEQNVANQDKISRRTEELDAALNQSVNGIAFSMDNFNQETAKQASIALSRPDKGKVLIPHGRPIGEAITRIPAPGVPEGFFDELEINKNNLRSSWGTQGITSQRQTSDTTARGMILNQQRDTSRIGGGIDDVLEQSVAKAVYDWLVQLYMVFYDERHFGAILGTGKATEYVELAGSDIDRQLIVGVAPNSMRPKDEISLMNQANELFDKGVIGPKKLLEAVKFPNADEAAADGALWMTDKKAYIQLNFPDLWEQLQALAAQQVPQPAAAPPGLSAGEPASAQMAQMAGGLPAVPPPPPAPPQPLGGE
ncbi:MAG: hypothetical protein KGI72_05320 [Patescibacteria group bacterium]|nr:hypothetical protein [Patescibacteria group bacterium]MDE2233080.1 hypothetical protein [Patescibacteria group bacterium]